MSRDERPFDVQRQVDEELEHYLDLRARELEESGLSPEVARVEAEARFGDRARIRSACVGIQRRRLRRRDRRERMTGIGKDLLHALRGLRRTPVTTAAALATLALGIGANAAVFSVVRSVLLRPLPFQDAHALVAVHETRGPDATVSSVAPANYLDWRSRVRTLESLAAYTERSMNLLEGDAPVRVRVGVVSGNFFRTLGLDAVAGRTFDPALRLDGGAREIVLSHDLWRSRFAGDHRMIGATLRLDGEAYDVVGVVEPGPGLPEGAALWVRAAAEAPGIPGFTGDITAMRTAWYFDVVGRLAPGVDLAAARGELDAVAAGLRAEHPEENAESGIRAIPLREALVGSTRGRLLVLFGAVGMVLLAVAANVASLALVRAEGRRRDFALRAALGAGGGRLARLVTFEGGLLALAGGGLGVVVAALSLPLLRTTLPPGLPRRSEVDMDGGVLLFALVASVVVCVLFALAPALMAGRSQPARALSDRGRGGGSRAGGRLRSALVVVEVTLGVALAVGTGLTVRSLRAMGEVEAGYRTDGLVTLSVSLPGADRQDVQETRLRWGSLHAAVSDLPGVVRAGIGITTPSRGGPEAGLRVVGEDADVAGDRSVVWHPTSPGYLETLGIPLLRGRLLEPGDRQGSGDVAVISETLAHRFFPGADPLGEHVTIGLDGGHSIAIEIVGVVGDTRNRGPVGEPRPVLYRPIRQAGGFGRGTMSVVARGDGAPSEVLRAMTAAVRRAEPTAVVYDPTVGEELDDLYFAEARFVSGLLGSFAALATVLAAIGIYGVNAHTVGRLRREIGIRKAIGASRATVWLSVLRGGLGPTLLGLVLGLALAAFTGRSLGAFLFGVGAVDAVTYGTVSLGLLAVAVLALAGPAWAAVRVDPAESIRAD